MIYAAIASALLVALHIWQDGVHPCNDGNRYTSGKAQPYPFNRRWCGWPKRVLEVVSLASLVALGALMGDWKRAVLLGTLPGFWFVATHPTTVDGPAMLLALGAALLFPTQPYAAVLLACASGYVHERGPVFAALYAWHPLLLIGLVASGWWRKAAEPDHDKLVGQGFLASLRAHKPYNDFLDWRINVFGLRAVPLVAAWSGAPLSAWATLAVAWCSRAVGTDACRFLFWAAPALLVRVGDVPSWVVLAHAVTFRRAI